MKITPANKLAMMQGAMLSMNEERIRGLTGAELLSSLGHLPVLQRKQSLSRVKHGPARSKTASQKRKAKRKQMKLSRRKNRS